MYVYVFILRSTVLKVIRLNCTSSVDISVSKRNYWHNEHNGLKIVDIAHCTTRICSIMGDGAGVGEQMYEGPFDQTLRQPRKHDDDGLYSDRTLVECGVHIQSMFTLVRNDKLFDSPKLPHRTNRRSRCIDRRGGIQGVALGPLALQLIEHFRCSSSSPDIAG